MFVTMRDVAAAARVSIKTVSRVVNNQGEISEATRQRVLKAIEVLGYRPSKVARSLVTQQTDTVGLILPDITDPFFPEVARGVEDVATAHGYSLFLCNSDSDDRQESRLLDSLAEHSVDGVILCPCSHHSNYAGPRGFADHHGPVVFVNHVFEHQNIGIVATDLERAGRLAVEHLIGKGHTAIAMLNGDDAPPDRRVEGFRAGLTAHGVPIRGEWIRSGRPVREQGYKAALELLSCYPEITAIFAYNDMLALGAIQACHELGRRVPQDCAVVGVNDISLADVTGPPLTTVRLPKYELGRRAMERLLDMLNAPDTSCPPVWMGVELVIRESA